MRPGQMTNVAAMGAAASTTYDLTAYYAAMSVQPDAARKTLLQSLANGLLADGVLAVWDDLYIIAAHDRQAARVSLTNPGHVASEVGTLSFTVDRGFVGDAVSSYLETGVADNAAGNWSQNTAAMFVWPDSSYAITTPGTAFGLSGVAGTRIQPATSGPPTARLHAATNVTGAGADSMGMITVVRTDSTNIRCDQNGVAGTPVTTTAAAATTADTFQILRGGGSFASIRACAAGKGGALTPTQSLAFYNRMRTYMTGVGVP